MPDETDDENLDAVSGQAEDMADEVSSMRSSAQKSVGGNSSTTAQTAVASKQKEADSDAPYLYTAHFSKKEDLIFAAGAGKNQMRVFDTVTGNIVAMISHCPRSILCSDVSHDDDLMAFGDSAARVRVFNIKKEQD